MRDSEEKEWVNMDAWPVAGNFVIDGNRPIDAKPTRLKDSESAADKDLEGVRVVLHGGMKEKVKQSAIIEFTCDRDKTGREGQWRSKRRRDEDEGDGDKDDKDDGKPERVPDPKDEERSLTVASYDRGTKDGDVLRLRWKTKYACEDQKDKDDGDDDPMSNRGWGGFTWFIIM